MKQPGRYVCGECGVYVYICVGVCVGMCRCTCGCMCGVCVCAHGYTHVWFKANGTVKSAILDPIIFPGSIEIYLIAIHPNEI